MSIPKSISPDAIEAIVATYFAKMTAMNPEGWVDDFAEDAISYDPVGHPPAKVHEKFERFSGNCKESMNS
jgi:steroid delta-isomerase